MSSIVPTSAIAASVAQGAHQQAQVARADDAQRNHRAQQAQRMKQALQRHLEEVEASSAVHAEEPVGDERHAHRKQPPARIKPDDHGDDRDDAEPRSRVDVTA